MLSLQNITLKTTKLRPPAYVMATFEDTRFSEDEIKQIIKDAGYSTWTIKDLMGTIRTFF